MARWTSDVWARRRSNSLSKSRIFGSVLMSGLLRWIEPCYDKIRTILGQSKRQGLSSRCSSSTTTSSAFPVCYFCLMLFWPRWSLVPFLRKATMYSTILERVKVFLWLCVWQASHFSEEFGVVSKHTHLCRDCSQDSIQESCKKSGGSFTLVGSSSTPWLV